MADLKLKIYDAANSLDFEIPLDSDKNSPFSLSKQLADLTDLTRRFGVQSYTFKVPISKDISDNFDFFNQSQHHNYKDVDGDKDCVILVDDEEIERGRIRIVDFLNTDGFEEVELLFYGSNYDWKERGKDKTLADLTFVNNSILYTPTTIKNSWSNTVDTGKEWVFPLEDRGGRELPSNLHTHDFRPAIFFHTILTLFFKSIGYTFVSDFMDSANFKRLVITHFGNRFKRMASNATVVDNIVKVGHVATGWFVENTVTYNIFQTNKFFLTDGVTNPQTTFTDTPLPFTDLGNNFDPSTPSISTTLDSTIQNIGKFTAPVSGIYDVHFDSILWIDFFDLYGGGGSRGELSFHLFFVKYNNNGVAYNTSSGTSFENTIIFKEIPIGVTTTDDIPVNGDIQINMLLGDYLILHFHVRHIGSTNSISGNFISRFKARETNLHYILNEKIVEGQTFFLTDVVDDNIKVLDIINDVSRMFNLYFDTDTVLKKIRIEPRDSYYYNIEDAVEFTDYLDVSKPIKTVYNSSFHKKNYKFSYAEDSKDIFVSERNKSQNNKIAEYNHVLPSKFQDGTTEIKTEVLGATYVAKDTGAIAVTDLILTPYVARYWNKYAETTPLEMLEDHAPRLLEYTYNTQGYGSVLFKFKFYDEINFRTIIPAVLPYAPFDGTNFLTVNFWNLYWHNIDIKKGLFENQYGKTMTEIINGTKMTTSIWVTQKLWKKFSFRNVVYIDEPIDIKGYWVVESLENYQPERSGLLRIELLKRINYDPQVEGTAILPDYPPLNGNERISYDTNPMLFLAQDGDGNTIKIAMTGIDTNGNESTLNS